MTLAFYRLRTSCLKATSAEAMEEAHAPPFKFLPKSYNPREIQTFFLKVATLGLHLTFDE